MTTHRHNVDILVWRNGICDKNFSYHTVRYDIIWSASNATLVACVWHLLSFYNWWI